MKQNSTNELYNYISILTLIDYFYRCTCRIRLNHKKRICNILNQHNHYELEETIEEGVDVTDNIQISITNRGNKCVFINRFKFIKCSENRGTLYFRCTYHTQQCRARVSISPNGTARATGEHNHS